MKDKVLDRDLNREAFSQMLSKGYDDAQTAKSELDINNFSPESSATEQPVTEPEVKEEGVAPAEEPKSEEEKTGEGTPAEEKKEVETADEGGVPADGDATKKTEETAESEEKPEEGETEDNQEELLSTVRNLLGIVSENEQPQEVQNQVAAVEKAAAESEKSPENADITAKLQAEIDKLNELVLQKEVKSEQDAREKERYQAELDSKNEEIERLNSELASSKESANLLETDDRVKSLAMFMNKLQAWEEWVKDDVKSILSELVQDIYWVNIDEMMKWMASQQDWTVNGAWNESFSGSKSDNKNKWVWLLDIRPFFNQNL